MSEHDPNAGAGELPDAEETELTALAVDDGKGGKTVPLSALLAAKRENKTLKGRVSELEPIATRAQDIEGKLNDAQPLINALLTDPTLRARAIQLAQGSKPTADHRQQPEADEEATGYAEDMGWYLSDNVTPDAARGRRVLNRVAAVAKRQTEEAVRPLAGLALGREARTNVNAAIAMSDPDGVPYASRESIEEAAKQLGPELLANPNVAQLLVRVAIGEDRLKGRTPKAPDEPLYMDRPTGGRRETPVMDANLKAALERTGITEKDATDSIRRLEQLSGRRGAVELGR